MSRGCRVEETSWSQLAARAVLFVAILPLLIWHSCTRRCSLAAAFWRLVHRATNQHAWCAPQLVWMTNGELWPCHYTATLLFASAVGQTPAAIWAARRQPRSINGWVCRGARPLMITIGWPARQPQHYHVVYYCGGVVQHSALFLPAATRRGGLSVGFPLRQDRVSSAARKAFDRVAEDASYRLGARRVAAMLRNLEQILLAVPNLEALVDTSFCNNTCLVSLDRTTKPHQRVRLRWPDESPSKG